MIWEVAVFLVFTLLTCAFGDSVTFEEHVAQYNLQFSESEWAKRKEIFLENLQRIRELNDRAAEFGHEVTFALNKFGHLNNNEFQGQFLRFNASHAAHLFPKATASDKVKTSFKSDLTYAADATRVDWREKNAVSPVRDQGQCGSCWAFSTVQQAESMLFMTGRASDVTELSVQQLVDCDTTGGSHWGCGGGWPTNAFSYMGDAGLMTEAQYPYVGKENPSCSYDKAKVMEYTIDLKAYEYPVGHCTGSACLDIVDDALIPVSRTQPLSVCVNSDAWQFYSTGVLADQFCPSSGSTINHCVQLVGFDLDFKTPYWTIRNSWNENWGEDGYIRVELGKNSCGIMDLVTTPTWEKASP